MLKIHSLHESDIKRIIAEKYGVSHFLDVMLKVKEERRLVGEHGGRNERRVTVYHVSANVYENTD